MKSEHQQRVEMLMCKAGQCVMPVPMVSSPEVRLLRARLILEEAIETVVKGLAVEISAGPGFIDSVEDLGLRVSTSQEPDLVEIADGCADISVVTIGTMSACGIRDVELLREVDESNLRKFGPGGYRRDDGKWVKPPDFQPPDIKGVLERQRAWNVFVYQGVENAS